MDCFRCPTSDRHLPDCGPRSRSRHGWSDRSLQDLPVQGKPVTVKLLLSRWRCAHQKCERQTFTDRLPTVASLIRAGRRGSWRLSACAAIARVDVLANASFNGSA
uniref:Probable transposase n=1 Tax=Rhizobium loti TaxID=381 RepID=M5ALK0_RHILI|nr:probable transposase [Mesorhizobium loti NZP2037]